MTSAAIILKNIDIQVAFEVAEYYIVIKSYNIFHYAECAFFKQFFNKFSLTERF